MNTEVTCVSSGHTDRKDTCAECGSGLHFKVDETKTVLFSYCPTFGCSKWLKQIPEPEPLKLKRVPHDT